ncbi:hypothetical protein L6452_42993 [Arctium lappa]|uniref:Uncharacterized protein n=1 Tax=Arctium lappa TaxID=4217 RepID=A0ACB8XKJ8_ARCLA|nr:hypothetical protein L6452_42993 [Arctium lappa]
MTLLPTLRNSRRSLSTRALYPPIELLTQWPHLPYSQVKPTSKKEYSKAFGTSALAKMTIRVKEPSVVSPVTYPSPKRRHSPSSPPSPLKRLRKVSRAKPQTPPTDSPQSAGVEIFPSGPGDSAKPKATSFVSSQKDTIVKSGTPIIPSSTFSLVDKDDLDSFPIQGVSSPPHSLSPRILSPDASARSKDESALPEAGSEDPGNLLTS